MPVPKPELAVAAVILEQLGGKRFLVMTGARHLLAHPSALSFRLPSNFARDGINHIHIELTALDLYDVTFARYRGIDLTHQVRVTDIDCEQLRSIFTETTGLALSL